MADPPKTPDDSVDSDAADVEDALLEGDRTIEPGGARAALGYPVFRRIFVAALVSNIGSWMGTSGPRLTMPEMKGSQTWTVSLRSIHFPAGGFTVTAFAE